jgi:hypothetical protein
MTALVDLTSQERRDVDLGGVRLGKDTRIMAMLVAAKHGPGREPMPRTPGPQAGAQPSSFVRNRHSLLPRPSTRAHRSAMRDPGAVRALAKPAAGRAGGADPLARTAGPACAGVPSGEREQLTARRLYPTRSLRSFATPRRSALPVGPAGSASAKWNASGTLNFSVRSSIQARNASAVRWEPARGTTTA